MNVLASLLPGLRDLRAPATAGYMWLLFIWLVSGTDLLGTGQSDAGARLVTLGEAIAIGGVTVAVSVAAYLVGAMSQEASTYLLSLVVVRRVDDKEETTLRKRVDEIFATARDALKAVQLSSQELVDRLGEVENRRNEAYKEVLDELELPATLLVGDHQQLFDQVDRLGAEGDFRAAVVPPLVALSLLMAISTKDLVWLGGILGSVLLARQGARQATQARRLAAQAIESGRVESPALKKQIDWVADFVGKVRDTVPAERPV